MAWAREQDTRMYTYIYAVNENLGDGYGDSGKGTYRDSVGYI